MATRSVTTLPKVPTLQDQRSKDLESVLDWMLAEVQSCDDGVAPEERGTFLSLACLLDTELRLRNPRRAARVVADATKRATKARRG